jgi:hypothetical protein
MNDDKKDEVAHSVHRAAPPEGLVTKLIFSISSYLLTPNAKPVVNPMAALIGVASACVNDGCTAISMIISRHGRTFSHAGQKNNDLSIGQIYLLIPPQS